MLCSLGLRAGQLLAVAESLAKGLIGRASLIASAAFDYYSGSEGHPQLLLPVSAFGAALK